MTCTPGYERRVTAVRYVEAWRGTVRDDVISDGALAVLTVHSRQRLYRELRQVCNSGEAAQDKADTARSLHLPVH